MKKKVITIIIAIALLFTASACNMETDDSDNEPAVVQQPSFGGEITIGLYDYIIDPAGFQPETLKVNKLDSILYRGLLKYDKDLSLKNDLIKSYSIDEEKKEIKLILKENISWTNDKTTAQTIDQKRLLTVDDVKFTYEFYSNPSYYGKWKDYSLNVVGTKEYRTGENDHVSGIIAYKEDRSITIQYENLTANDLEFLTAPILSKEQLQDKTVEQVKELSLSGDLVSNGLYKIKSKTDNQVILVRSEFSEESTYLDKITVMKKNSNADYDVELALPQEVADVTKSAPSIDDQQEIDKNKDKEEEVPEVDLIKKEVVSTHGEGYQYLGMNLNSPNFKELEVRKAIKTLINEDAIINNVYYGYADKVKSPFHPKSWAYVENKQISNIEEAKKLIVGKNLSLNLAYQENEISQKIADELSKQLKQYGIIINLLPIKVEEYIASLFSKGEYDLFLASWAYEIDPAYENVKWLAKNDVLLGGYNVSHINDEKSDEYLLNGETSLKVEDRKKIYQEWQKYFIDQTYIIPIPSAQTMFIHKSTVHINIENSLTPYHDIKKWWIEK